MNEINLLSNERKAKYNAIADGMVILTNTDYEKKLNKALKQNKSDEKISNVKYTELSQVSWGKIPDKKYNKVISKLNYDTRCNPYCED